MSEETEELEARETMEESENEEGFFAAPDCILDSILTLVLELIEPLAAELPRISNNNIGRRNNAKVTIRRTHLLMRNLK